VNQSVEINELLKALSLAQAALKGAIKESVNPFFKSKYADLATVWEACQKPLTENGLSVTMPLEFVNGEQFLSAILGHSSGQWIKSMMKLPEMTKNEKNKPDVQGLGSSITYYRRYMLSALIGVCPEDDDGESAVGRNKSNSTRGEQKKSSEGLDNFPENVTFSPSVVEERLKDFPEYRANLLKFYKVNSFEELRQYQYPSLFNAIKKHEEYKNSSKTKK
jgi:hypothetical protein